MPSACFFGQLVAVHKTCDRFFIPLSIVGAQIAASCFFGANSLTVEKRSKMALYWLEMHLKHILFLAARAAQ